MSGLRLAKMHLVRSFETGRNPGSTEEIPGSKSFPADAFFEQCLFSGPQACFFAQKASRQSEAEQGPEGFVDRLIFLSYTIVIRFSKGDIR
jgi:hypothetical protein